MAKLLVIDDDPDILKLIRKTLEKDGHQVDVETDPALWARTGAGSMI